MIKAIFFDLDGTLLNTSYDIHSVLNNTLTAFNLPTITLEQTISYVGNGAKKLVERAIPKDKMSLFEDVYRHYAKKFANCDNKQTQFYDGEENVLDDFRLSGIKMAVITNKPQDATDGVYHQHLERFAFCDVIGQSELHPLKPNPESVLGLMRKYGVTESECVFVGDGETDVQTAMNANIPCVSVLWGYRTKEQLQKAGANLFAESYRELKTIIKNL